MKTIIRFARRLSLAFATVALPFYSFSLSAGTTLLNVDFGEGFVGSAKVGPAATGQSANDFWNFYTRDDASGWRTFGGVSNLKRADGTPTAAGLTVANAPGSWGNGSSDAMYVGYNYPFDGGNVTVQVTNLAAGSYDLYVYASDLNCQLQAGGVDYGIKTALDNAPTGVPVWQEGRQYVRYANVAVNAGQAMVITVRPGVYGYATISGMQLVLADTAPPPAFLVSLDFGAGAAASAKVGPAATGQGANDFWNFYTRDDNAGGWLTFGAVSNLKLVNGTATEVGMTVANAPGAWGTTSSDAMYVGYIYPFSGVATLTVTNLPTGAYDFYLYAPDGKYELTAGSMNHGIRSCVDPSATGVPVWQEGVQYARFTNVAVNAGQPVVITVQPGISGYAIISGMQIARVGTVTSGVPAAFATQPTSQTVFAGAEVTFLASATGTEPLGFQWRLNGTNIVGATGTTLLRPNVQATDAGNYSVQVSNAFGTATSTNAALVVVQPATNVLLNVDFGAGHSGSAKVGPAAIGQSASDFWNFYTRDDNAGGWLTFGGVSNLKRADGTPTAAGLTVANAPGSWGNGSSDAMYVGYDYPFDGGNVTVEVTNLAAGSYDLYVYASDLNCHVQAGSVDYGIKTALDETPTGIPVWQEGRQYVRYGNVAVAAGQTMVITVRPGVYGYAVISGMQLVLADTPPPTSFVASVDFGAGYAGSAKVGPAAIGQSASDFWNFYTRDDNAGGWLTFGAVSNLKLVNGTATEVGMTVANAPGAWGTTSSDAMYVGYIYPFDGVATVTVTNLPAGSYDFYLYAPDGKYELTAGSMNYGIKSCVDPSASGVPVWQEGVQYSRFANVAVNTGQPVVITVLPGMYGYAVISGIQIARVGTVAGVPPTLVTQPTSQTVFAGAEVTFSAGATGTEPLSFQWRWNGSNIVGATGPTLVRQDVKPTDAGNYSVQVSNAFGTATSTNATLVVVQPATNVLLNVDFGAGHSGSAKVGPAAIGQSASDFWNFYTRDDNAGGWLTFGAVSNLKLVNGTATEVGMTVANAPGAWGTTSSDAMYVGYIYPFSGVATLTVTNLPAGSYDFYLYAPDGKYALTAGSMNYGIKSCVDPSASGVPVWQEGVQYARFANVAVDAGQPVVITVQPGIYGYAIISGMQMAAVNLRPIAIPQTVTVNQESSVAVAVTGSDSDNDPLTFSIMTPPSHGTLSGNAPNLTYTPNPGYFGPDEFTFKANDGFGDSQPARVNITVMRVNHPPVADASATVPLVISPNNTNAIVALDGSRSSDPDGNALQYLWFVAGAPDAFATGVVSVVTLPVGTNFISLVVDDGLATATNQIKAEVITPAQAVKRLAQAVRDGVPRSHPLMVTLAAALASIDRSQPTAAIILLQTFQNQVRAQVSPRDPARAAQFILAAREIINALTGATPDRGGRARFHRAERQPDGKFKMQLTATPGRIYVVEASADLVHWEAIGVVRQGLNAEFEFEDANAPRFAGRFYRIVAP